ncbi:polyprenyl synthetase family protein [Myxococcus sp. K15C18031901]|uniref:polyprenyl synthetase family protein n=1 Tax=Myxococcus dinghuensis TaxID=2906761 RepID=UPI0020A82D6D|nr:polyprenyl synthetase family protein [Myxococcus dinghuensis]MCP3100724.1 polyprenyl synthetase family protein [Myxococcus dinghuensis]
MTTHALHGYLEDCRKLVIEEIQRIIPKDERRASFYGMMLDYPFREAKGLRPALCIATCRALGGKLESVASSAAVLELYHNAFLIHDDIEDESLLRRNAPTLHRQHGVAVAVNVGDGMLALSLQPLLENVARLGLGASLRILQAVARMTRESVEGQALELEWIRNHVWDLSDDDYILMVEQKTGWYSFITPVLIGAIAAGAPEGRMELLSGFSRALGTAFQIQDDLLNLQAAERDYGKEIAGDLWEGKRTLMLLHALRVSTPEERAEAKRVLSLARPRETADTPHSPLHQALEALRREGELTSRGHAALLEAMRHTLAPAKTEQDVRFLGSLLERHESMAYARRVAHQHMEDARRHFDRCREWLAPSIHRDFLEQLMDYVLSRIR